MRNDRYTYLLIISLLAFSFFPLEKSIAQSRNVVVPRSQQTEEIRQEATRKSRTATRLEQRGQIDEALAIWDLLADQFPDNSSYFEGQVRCLTTLARYNEAARLLEERIPLEIDQRQKAEYLVRLGGVYQKLNKPTQAEVNYRQAEETARGVEGAYHAVAMEFLRQRQTERAISILKSSRVDLENPYLHAFTIASLKQNTMDWAGATEEYLLALQESGTRRQSVLRSFATFPNDPNTDKAVEASIRAELDRTEKEQPWPGYRDALWQILIDQRIKSGNFEGAVDLLETIQEEEGEEGWLLQFAQTAVDEGAHDAARRALEIAAQRTQSENRRAEVDLALATLVQAEGDFSQADSLYGTVIGRLEKNPTLAYSALIRRGQMRLTYVDNPLGALEDFEHLAELQGKQVEQQVEYLLAATLLRLHRYDEARPHLQQTISPQLPDEPQRGRRRPRQPVAYDAGLGAHAAYLNARLSWWENNPERTTAILDSMLKHPTGAEVENEAFDLLFLLSSKADSSILRRFAQTDQALFEQRVEDAENMLASIATDTASSLSANASWWLVEIAVQTGAEDVPEVVDAYVTQYPGTPRAEEAWLNLGIWYEDQGLTDEAKTCYETILIDYYDGLLTSEARLRLDQLAGMELPPLQPPSPFETP